MNQFSLFGESPIPKPLFKSSKVNPCERCVLAGKSKVQDDGNIDTAKVIIVGEAPTSDTVFSDKGGRLLRTLLDKCNFTNLYFTNVVRCCPDDAIPQNNIIKCCRRNLEETLNKAVNKKLIIVCGDTALYWFTKQEGKQHRGFFFDSKWGKIFSILSPIHILKNLNIKDISGKDSLDFLAEDLKRAKIYIESGRTSIDISDKIHIAKTHKEFIDMISSMEHLIGNKDERVGIDFETDSLEIYNPQIKLLSTSIAVNKNLVWCIPFKFIEDVSIIEEAYTVVKFIMDNLNLLMHNASFDLILGHLKFGCKLNQVDDTMLMYYLLDGNRGGSSKLKRLANDWTDFGDYGVDYETMHELNEPELVDYNCKDALVPLYLYEQFYSKMDYGMKFCYFQIIKKAQLALIHASINGMKIDANYALSVQKKLQKQFETIENTTKAYGLNLSSPKQVLAYLNQHRNIPVTSTNQDTLELYKQDEFVDLLLRYRKIALLKRTYVEPMLLEHSKNDNLVHPQFNIGLTATGRISCSKPNLQNIPTRDGPLIEKMFISRFENGYIGKADYGQMELRVAAVYSNDRKMIEFFNSGKDIHRMTAVEIYGTPDEWFDSDDPEKRKKAKEARRVAKGFNFGVIYGRGAKSIAIELNIDPMEAELLRRKYFDLFPDLKRWIDTTQNQAIEDGYVKSLFGRVRYIPELKSDNVFVRGNGLREAVNTPIQSMASDMALLGAYECLNEILTRNLKSKFINFIHDAMLFDIPKEELEQVICIIKEKAINVIDNLKIPLEIDIQFGTSWGDME